jgi:hypothetical protein
MVDHFTNKRSPYINTHCCHVTHIMKKIQILQRGYVRHVAARRSPEARNLCSVDVPLVVSICATQTAIYIFDMLLQTQAYGYL